MSALVKLGQGVEHPDKGPLVTEIRPNQGIPKGREALRQQGSAGFPL